MSYIHEQPVVSIGFNIAEAQVYKNKVEFMNDAAFWTEDLEDALVDIHDALNDMMRLREAVLEQIKLKEKGNER